MKDLLNKAASSVDSAVQSTKETVTGKIADTAHLGRNAIFAVENKVLSVRDSALDTATGFAGATIKLYRGVAGTVKTMIELGVVVVTVVAPVPTFIGVALLWLLEQQLKKSNAATDKAIDGARDQRKFERVTGLLKKYGQIPETATLQTELIHMTIDSKTGDVKGSVLSGEFCGRELSSLSSEDIARMLDFAPDKDTKSILEAYSSLRNAKTIVGSDDESSQNVIV